MKLTKRKGFNFLRSYFDVVNKIPKEEDKLNFLLALLNKQFLDEDPKDSNFLVELCYESQRHQIEKSVKGWKKASYTDLLGNPLGDPKGDPPSDPKGDPKEEEEKEEEEEEEKEKEEQKQKTEVVFSFFKSLLALGVDEQIAKDWLVVRKNKKASNTKTALNTIEKEIRKSGRAANDCIRVSVENSWSGFKADYLRPFSQSNNKSEIKRKDIPL